jgi:hypothetical protein
MYYRRLDGEAAPWTDDPILSAYRFTNTYRAADRVSQYLIRNVQYCPERSQLPTEIYFRTMLFKIFNKIETWEVLERKFGPLSWMTVDLETLDRELSNMMARGLRIYSAAYIMPAPSYGEERKHTNHLKLIAKMMADRVPDRVRQAPSLAAIYETILSYSGLGPFLAFQYTIDLNYSHMLYFGEDEFVIAGPGALDGISKCFSSTGGLSSEQLIRWVTERQEQELASRGLSFRGLFGRRLQPIDCQNLFCEISKYSRIAHPEFTPVGGRKRIKQGFGNDRHELLPAFFPPRWRLDVPIASSRPDAGEREKQAVLF